MEWGFCVLEKRRDASIGSSRCPFYETSHVNPGGWDDRQPFSAKVSEEYVPNPRFRPSFLPLSLSGHKVQTGRY